MHTLLLGEAFDEVFITWLLMCVRCMNLQKMALNFAKHVSKSLSNGD